jgi:hypothetical protein
MSPTLVEIEDVIGETGVTREQVLNFVRLIPSSDLNVIKPMIETWIGEMRATGVEVDEKYVARMLHDFEVHGRLLPDTIDGLPAARVPTLRRSKVMEDSNE